MAHGRIGPFVLGGPLGEGSYGEVWEGRHERSKARVAVKFLPWQDAGDPGLRQALDREARLLATLDHPHVVRLLDHRAVTARESASFQGRWPVGNPYLVLEYVGGGTCSSHRGALPWAATRDVLFRVLDALAHAHARGVIHLDLKPANILLGGRQVGQEDLDSRSDPMNLVAGLRLADFGIAGVFGRASGRRGSPGTPAYMAPEQLRQAWRDFGPWTDLYALGCVGWALLTGVSPFHGLRGRDLAMAHAYEAPPRLAPRVPVPAGVEDWLRTLLEKDPGKRPARCAEAAVALAALGDPSGGQSDPGRGQPDPGTEGPTLRVSDEATALFPGWAADTPDVSASPDPTATLAAENLGTVCTWRRAEPPPTPLMLADAGLGLIGLRMPRLVGREAERDLLWQALLRVRETHRAEAVVLRGPRGRGVSRLALWLARRGHELGIATPVVVAHGRDLPDALTTTVRDWLRGWGLARDALELRIARMLRRWGRDQPWLAGLAAGLLVEGQTAARSRDADGVLAGLMEAAGSRRTLVLVVDDAQWGAPSLRLVQALLAAEQVRVLVVLTVQDDVEADAPAAAALEPVLAHERCQVLGVPPLREQDARKLVEDILLLEPLLAARVVGLAGGSPEFALHVVSDWVQHDLLLPTPEGFVLQDPDATGLPVDLAQVLLDRLAPLELRDVASLELATALGSSFDRQEWLVLCPSGEAVARRAVDAGLLEASRHGWRFSGGAVREVLAERARREGRWADHHRRCGRLLEGRPGAGTRLGRHLLESGEAARAFELLFEQAQRARTEGRGQDALRLADQTARALGVLMPEPDDERLGQQLALECRLLRDLGDTETLALRAGRLLDRARAHGWRTLEGEALRAQALAMRAARDRRCEQVFQASLGLFVGLGDAWRACRVQTDLANLYSMTGRPDDALQMADQAARGARALGDQEGLAMALLARSLARERRGDLDGALADAQDGVAITVAEGVPLWIVGARRRLAQVLAAHHEPDRARVELEQVVAMYREQLDIGGLAVMLNTLGDLERQGGDRAAAERCYREVVDMGRLVGHSRHFARLNLALLWLQAGRPAEVIPLIEPVREHASGIHHGLLEACACALLTWAHASLGDGAALAPVLERAEVLISEHGLPDRDLAISLEQAGLQAAETLDHPTAARALALAASIHECRGDHGAAQACRARL